MRPRRSDWRTCSPATPATAEDLAHEAFIKVAGRFHHLRNPEAFAAYLRKTVVNLSMSHHRRKRVERDHLARESSRPAATSVEPPDVRAIDRTEGTTPVDDPCADYEVFERIAQIEGFTVTSPSDLYLVHQWTLGRFGRCELDDRREQRLEACGDLPPRRNAARAGLGSAAFRATDGSSPCSCSVSTITDWKARHASTHRSR